MSPSLIASISVRAKLRLITALALLGLCLLGAFASFTLRDTLFEDRKAKTKNVVETAFSVLTHFETLEQNGQMSREQAQTSALSVLKSLRYDGDNYFWVNDLQPVMIMHPIKPELDGKDLSQSRDASGKLLFIAFVELAIKQGEGFVEYHWSKPGMAEAVRKVSYIKAFANWGWIVGSGIYLDDVDRLFWQAVRSLLIFMVVSLLALMATSRLVARSVVVPLNACKRMFAQVAEGNLNAHYSEQAVDTRDNHHETSKKEQKNEITSMVQSLKEMIYALKEMVQGVASKADQLGNSSQALHSVAEQLTENANGLNQQACQIDVAAVQMQSNLGSISGTARQMSDRMQEVSENSDVMTGDMHTISSAAEQVSVNLSEIARSSSLVNKSMDRVMESAQRSSSNVSTIAAAVEEMTASLSGVRNRCQAAKQEAEQAQGGANATLQVMERLGNATREIGRVVGIINTIANQTNMLALNAAIEAAGAGEAGKGFSVVATEVKNLAKQTSEALQLVSSQVQTIQGNTREASSATQQISELIERLRHSNVGILQAVDDQSQALDEISRSMSDVARETGQVTEEVQVAGEGIKELTRNVSEITLGVTDVTRSVLGASVNMNNSRENMRAVANGAGQVSGDVQQANQAAQEMVNHAREVTQSADGMQQISQTMMKQAAEMRHVALALDEALQRFTTHD
ncbi:MAG: cache domain-containing protein [Magnetococcales bacterium]|nr:cache domain-containing protein [Magnetococcales bacterium]